MQNICVILGFILINIGKLDAQQDSIEWAQDFSFYHENGETQSLSQYEGDVVFISFWATWCKPCLVNFQEYEDLRRELQQKGVILLNVSLDNVKSNWENALMSYGFLIGENVHVSDIRELMDLYDLTFIPAYRIVNKKGEFVYLSDQADRNVVAEFEAWLK